MSTEPVTIDDVFDSVIGVVRAQTEYDEKRERALVEIGSGSWDYRGDAIDKLNKAKETARDNVTALIRQEAREVVKEELARMPWPDTGVNE